MLLACVVESHTTGANSAHQKTNPVAAPPQLYTIVVIQFQLHSVCAAIGCTYVCLCVCACPWANRRTKAAATMCACACVRVCGQTDHEGSLMVAVALSVARTCVHAPCSWDHMAGRSICHDWSVSAVPRRCPMLPPGWLTPNFSFVKSVSATTAPTSRLQIACAQTRRMHTHTHTHAHTQTHT
jgi:hypothetical protein